MYFLTNFPISIEHKIENWVEFFNAPQHDTKTSIDLKVDFWLHDTFQECYWKVAWLVLCNSSNKMSDLTIVLLFEIQNVLI